MTVTSSTNSASYAGNGVSTDFTVPFRFLDNSHLRVVLVDADGTERIQVLNTDYTASGAGNATGDITFGTAPETGQTVQIFRNVPITQEKDYVTGDKFPAESHEQALDKLTMIAQQQDEKIGRAWLSPVGEPGGKIIVGAADTVAVFDADGNLVEGPSAAEIENAEGYAEDAAQSATDAETAEAGAVAAKVAAEGFAEAAAAAGANEFAATRDTIKALNTAAVTHVYLTEAGREGQFLWDSSDVSATLLGSDITSTSIASNVITSANHSLLLGDAVLVASAVNGLSTNTLYWVIWLSSSTFSLAASFEDAVAGTAVTLTSTDATTVKRHLDPLEGLYVCPEDDLSGSSGAWVRQGDMGRVNVRWFGSTGDGETYDDGALICAFRSVASDPISISNVKAYTAGKVYVPKGQYLVRPNILDLTGLIGLILEGDGARLTNSYKQAATSIIVDGTDTTSADWLIKLNTNNSRAFQASGIAFEYKNSFAGDIIMGDAPGVFIDKCSFGSTVVSGTRPNTANSALRFWEGHHYNVTHCSFTDFKTHVIIDNETATNTNRWMIHGNSFYDCTDAFLNVTGSNAWALSIVNNDFDPIVTNPTEGIIIRAHGFVCEANSFAGSSLDDGPTNNWIKVISGYGKIIGNLFWSAATSWAVSVEAGNVEVSNNLGYVVNGIKYSNISIATGGSNRWIHQGSGTTDVAVQFGMAGLSTFVEWDMDTIDAGFKNSYVMNGGTATEGKVNYNSTVDLSADGPLFTTDFPKLSVPPGKRVSKTANYTITTKDWGTTFDNIGATGAITFTLPDCVQGMPFHFVRYADQNITVQRAGSDVILPGSGTTVATSISHTTASSFGAALTLRAFTGTQWIKEAATGGW